MNPFPSKTNVHVQKKWHLFSFTAGSDVSSIARAHLLNCAKLEACLFATLGDIWRSGTPVVCPSVFLLTEYI